MRPRSQDPEDLWAEIKSLLDTLFLPPSEEEARQDYLRFLKRLSMRCRADAEAAGVSFEPLEEAEARGVVIRPFRSALPVRLGVVQDHR